MRYAKVLLVTGVVTATSLAGMALLKRAPSDVAQVRLNRVLCVKRWFVFRREVQVTASPIKEWRGW